jgi:hypothetical protein
MRPFRRSSLVFILLALSTFARASIPGDRRLQTFHLTVDDDRGRTESDLEQLIRDSPAVLVAYLDHRLHDLSERGAVFAIMTPDTTAWFIHEFVVSSIYSVHFEPAHRKIRVSDFQWMLFQQDRGMPIDQRAISVKMSSDGRFPGIIELSLPAEWEAGVPCEFLFAP